MSDMPDWLQNIFDGAGQASSAAVDTLNQAGSHLSLPGAQPAVAAPVTPEPRYDLPDGRSMTFDELTKAANSGDTEAMKRIVQGDVWKKSLVDSATKDAQRANESPEDTAARKAVQDRAEAEIAQTAANTAYQRAQAEKIQNDIRDSNDPQRQAILQTQLVTAQSELSRSQLQLQKMMSDMSPEDQIRLRAKLDADNNRMSQDATKELTLLKIGSDSALEDKRAGNNLDLDRQKGDRDLLINATNTGVQVRGQELDRLKQQDQMTINLLTQQIQAGKLSLDKATQMFTANLERARLPSQIMANVAAAVAPYMPYATSNKTGDTPLGFERGGSMDVLGRMGGNSAQSYDPSKYTVKTTGLPFDVGKMSKVPHLADPYKGLPAVPTVPTTATSATGGLADPNTYIQQQAQQAALGGGAAPGASPPPPPPSGDARPPMMQGIVPNRPPMTDEERRKLMGV